MAIAFEFEPSEVLGVGAQASLQEIRDAYHARSKRHHPDVGGEDWAFRVLTRCYEVLSRARVLARAHDEAERSATASTPRAEPIKVRPEDSAAGRRGVSDPVADPSRLVAVETLIIRFEEADPHAFLLRPAGDKNLSCTLQVHWPAPALAPRPEAIAGAERLARSVAAAFDAAKAATRPTTSRGDLGDDRFSGWLTYPTVAQVSEALTKFRAKLAPLGLGVQQTIREHNVPRDWARS